MEMNKTVLYNAIGLGVAAAAAFAFFYFERTGPSSTGAGASQPAEAPRGLNKPRGLALNAQGKVVVANSRHHRVEVLEPTGAEISRFGMEGTADGQFREPCDVAVDSEGNLYVADTFHSVADGGGLPWGRVQKFSPQGKFLASWGKLPVAPSDLFGPRSIAVNSKDEVFLADTGNHRLIKYDKNGKFLAQVGAKGSKPGEFIEPFGLAFDASDNLYVADRLNFRVQVLDSGLKFKSQFKVEGWDSAQINMEPYLAVDNKGRRLFVSDPLKNKVYSYRLDGSGRKEYTGGEKGPFNLPTGLAFDPGTGTLIVSDGGNRLVTLKP